MLTKADAVHATLHVLKVLGIVKMMLTAMEILSVDKIIASSLDISFMKKTTVA